MSRYPAVVAANLTGALRLKVTSLQTFKAEAYQPPGNPRLGCIWALDGRTIFITAPVTAIPHLDPSVAIWLQIHRGGTRAARKWHRG